MASEKTNIWVYADWVGMPIPKCIGVLSVQQARGKKAFSFAYDPSWLQSHEQIKLDPDLEWFSGPQFPLQKENFGIFLDSMPDRWGRTLMKRRAIQVAKEKNEPTPTLHEIDFLLGVEDESRMGALRFKTDPEGQFLNYNKISPIPPISSIRELQQAVKRVESDTESKDIRKWLSILLAPGSSLGGARPKANVLDEHGHLWIAKFPSKNDDYDKGNWEFLTYRLAIEAGISMTKSMAQKVSGNYHIFLTKRFDRINKNRIHFASAMTMTGNTEDTLKNKEASYLDLAEFIQFSGTNIKVDLQQLWRRVVFSIAISNTDDHLRNHGFLLSSDGWRLSPAYDLNPSIDKDGLSLNIDAENNSLDFELAKSVGEYFQLTIPEMNTILNEVKSTVKTWQKIAKEIKIPRIEQEMMEAAFRF